VVLDDGEDALSWDPWSRIVTPPQPVSA
jgi:hypothetical protein